jgi:hypothetical protein
MKDLHSNIGLALLIEAAVLSADNTPLAVDLQGFDAAEIALLIGVGGITFTGSNKIEFKLTHSNDGTNYDAVEAKDVLGEASVGSGGIIKALIAAHASSAAYRFGYVGGRRYLKLLADFSGTHGSGTPIAAAVIKGHPHVAPVANAA